MLLLDSGPPLDDPFLDQFQGGQQGEGPQLNLPQDATNSKMK